MSALAAPDPDAERDWLSPEPDEELLWAGTPRISTILPAVAIGVLLVGAGLALAVIVDPRLGLAASLGVIPPAWSYLVVTNTRFAVTSEALYAKRGVLGRVVERVPLTSVQNSSFSQDLAGRLFGYGSVTFEEAGGSGLRFYRIESPRDVRRFVDRRAGRSPRSSFPGTADQWAAVRDEVRALAAAVDGRR